MCILAQTFPMRTAMRATKHVPGARRLDTTVLRLVNFPGKGDADSRKIPQALEYFGPGDETQSQGTRQQIIGETLRSPSESSLSAD